MNPQVEALKANRTVVATVVVAAAAVALFALLGIARLLGWLPVAPPPAPPVIAGAPAPKVAAAGVDLLPGETLVEPASTPPRADPMMPTYSPPAAPAPAPPAEPEPIEKPRPPPPVRVEQRPVERYPVPVRPRYAHPTDPTDDWPRSASSCRNCGTVTGIVTYSDAWEVRVRLEDGDGRVVRYRTRPPWRLGERVRFENGRLEPL
jgi:hypothetical protein